MNLDYIDKINGYGDNVVRLYNFDFTQAIQFLDIFKETVITGKKPLDFSKISFIQSRNCNLILRICDEDLGVTTEDDKNFFCDMTIDGYEKMIPLIVPFCKKESKGYQYLYDVDSLTDLLFSPYGTW
jgi:hypothetical protein